MRKLSALLLAALLLVAALPARSMLAQEAPTKTIAELVVDAAGAKDKPEFTVLLAAIKAADPAFLTALSNKAGKFTVFAPTDAAFKALLDALKMKPEELLANKNLLNVVLAYHVVAGVALDAASVVKADGAYVGTVLANNALKISVKDNTVSINASKVVTADLKAVNGVVHVIDAVLVPDDAVNMAASMGQMMAATMDATAKKPVTIAETVVASAGGSKPEFATLLAAVKAADPAVLATLGSTGGDVYTVFAPTDAAFTAAIAALKTTAADLLKNKDLTNILLYHVAPGSLNAASIIKLAGKDGFKLVTLLPGQLLSIKVVDGKVVINDGPKVAAADVATSNGIVHVIDGVLLPKS